MPVLPKSVLRKVIAALAVSGSTRGLTIRSQPPLGDNDASRSWSNAFVGFQHSDMITAAHDLQSHFFDYSSGVWPGSPEWTTAVFGTHLCAVVKTISDNNALTEFEREELVNDFFQDITLYYAGQDWFAILTQAYDDILWVVLNWLEASTFVQGHAAKRHAGSWHGEKLLGAMAHRARVFWDAATRGWDETACGGGMNWNPRLTMYKNAITNQLWIAASASMYVNFAGDDNEAPIAPINIANPAMSAADVHDVPADQSQSFGDRPIYPAHDPKYLNAAIKGYNWLMNSNMKNAQGLFIDGFHLSDDGSRQCTERGETVWSYNQGVLLTGQRYLWQGTGSSKYLSDGHELIRNVIKATGWDLATKTASRDPDYQGLGRLGVMEEPCDQAGTCNTDQQAFKGIYFLHYNTFCQPLPTQGSSAFGFKASPELAASHAAQCASYGPWIAHNAQAAMSTRDPAGLFGMWWNAKSYPAAKEKRMNELVMGETSNGKEIGAADILGHNFWKKSLETTELMQDSMGAMYQRAWDVQDGGDEGVHFNSFVQAPDPGHRSAEMQSGGLSVIRAAVEQGMR